MVALLKGSLWVVGWEHGCGMGAWLWMLASPTFGGKNTTAWRFGGETMEEWFVGGRAGFEIKEKR